MRNDDPFEALKAEQRRVATTPGAPQKPSTSHIPSEPPANTPPVAAPDGRIRAVAPTTVPEQSADTREILHGIYVDEAMDDFINAYVDRKLEGSRRRPSRSLVGYWLLTIAKATLEERGLPPMPADFAKRRGAKD